MVALNNGDGEISCCPRAEQVAPFVATLASLAGSVPDICFKEAPELAYAAEAVATAFLYVERIQMVSCSLGGSGIAALARGFSNLERTEDTVCKVLDLSQNGLSGDDMGTLAGPLVRAVPGLQALNVELNPLGSDGVRALAPLLVPSASSTAPCSLRVLSLRGCGVHDGGLSALASCLVQGGATSSACSSLRVLDISDNPAGSSGVVALCAALTSQLAVGVALQRARAASAPEEEIPGVAELLLRGLPCDAAALQALAGLLMATADVHKQTHIRGGGAFAGVVPGLQYLDLTGVARSSQAAASSGDNHEYRSGVLSLLHACQSLVASSSGAVQMDGLAQLQACGEALHGSEHALLVSTPVGRGSLAVGHKLAMSPAARQPGAMGDKWASIMQRLQGATASLAAVHAAAGSLTQTPHTALLASKLSSNAESSSDDSGVADEGTLLPDGVTPAIAEFVKSQVQQAARQLRAELDSDVGTLLSEVAATSARIEQLEEIVRAEQAASMQLLENLMSMQGDS